MTLRHMRIFVSVYQLNSITKAAEALHLAQPSVSLAVSELEGYYGIRLFDRISRRIYATEQGDRFYGYALHIVSLFDEMEHGIRNWESFGTLRTGSSVTIGNYLLPDIITGFRQQYPDITIQALIRNSSDIEQCILNNEIDLALVEGPPESPMIQRYPFRDDRLCLIASASHPLHQKAEIGFSELLQYPILLREKGSAGREILEDFLTLHGMSIRPLWESISTQAIVAGVAQGHGISILPYLMVKGDLKEGRIVELPVKDMSLSRKFYIIYHKNKYLTASAKAFIDLCKQA